MVSFIKIVNESFSTWRKVLFPQLISNLLFGMIAIVLILPLAFGISIITEGGGSPVNNILFWGLVIMLIAVIFFIGSLEMGSSWLLAKKFDDEGQTLFDPSQLKELRGPILPLIMNAVIYGSLLVLPNIFIEQWKVENAPVDLNLQLLLLVFIVLYTLIIIPAGIFATVDAILGSKGFASFINGGKIYIESPVPVFLTGATFGVALVILVRPIAWWGNNIAPQGSGIIFFSTLFLIIVGLAVWALILLPAILFMPWVFYKYIDEAKD